MGKNWGDTPSATLSYRPSHFFMEIKAPFFDKSILDKRMA